MPTPWCRIFQIFVLFLTLFSTLMLFNIYRADFLLTCMALMSECPKLTCRHCLCWRLHPSHTYKLHETESLFLSQERQSRSLSHWSSPTSPLWPLWNPQQECEDNTEYLGFAWFSNVEFTVAGQDGWYNPWNPRFALAYLLGIGQTSNSKAAKYSVSTPVREFTGGRHVSYVSEIKMNWKVTSFVLTWIFSQSTLLRPSCLRSSPSHLGAVILMR